MELATVLATSLKLIPFSAADNQPRSKITRKQAENNNAMRLAEEDHDRIMDEIQLRDRLEYDPMMVMASEEEEGELAIINLESREESARIYLSERKFYYEGPRGQRLSFLFLDAPIPIFNPDFQSEMNHGTFGKSIMKARR